MSSKIIIIILWFNIMASLFLIPNYNPNFIFGIAGLSIVTITYTKFNDFSFGFLALILFLSIFNAVTFSYAFSFHIGLFNLPSLILFCVLFFTHIGKFLELKEKWFGSNETEIDDQKANKINIFKTQFQNLTESELRTKLEIGGLVDEAKIAVNELLDQKAANPDKNFETKI